MYCRSRSIIIKNIDYRDADKIVTAFTEKEGKIRAVARGIKKPGSSLRASVQPFCHSLLFYNRGREMELITQGQLLEFYGEIRQDIKSTLYAVYLMELLDKALLERVSLPQLYHATLATLGYLNSEGYNPLIIRYFESSLLVCLGYQPVLNECTGCKTPGSSLVNFDASSGGMICSECSRETSNCLPVSGESLALLRLLTGGQAAAVKRAKASGKALQEIEKVLEKYLEYHLESRLNTKNNIRILKGMIADMG